MFDRGIYRIPVRVRVSYEGFRSSFYNSVSVSGMTLNFYKLYNNEQYKAFINGP